MTTSNGLEPQYVERFRQRLEQAGGKLTRLTYPRPAAQGDVRAYLSVPKSPRALVVIAHATGNDCLYPQASLIEALARAGIAAFSFDIDGHGVGSTTLLHHMGLGDAAVTAIDIAAEHVPGVPIYGLGASLGGVLMLNAASHRDLAGLVLLVMPTKITSSLAALVIEGAGLVRPGVLRHLPYYGAGGLFPAIGPFRRSAFPMRLAAGLGRDMFAYLRVVTEFITTQRPLDVAAKVRARALLVYGGHDLIAPAAQGRELAAVMPSARYVHMPFGTHFGTPLLPATERLVVDFVRHA